MNFERTPNVTLLFLFFVLTSVLSACWTIPGIVSRQAAPRSVTGGSGLANGERIYFTATNAEGERIPYSDGPEFGGMMMGSYLTCAACHGPAGEGIEGLGKDMTTSEFIAGNTDDELVAFIKVGRDPSDPLNTTGVGMPASGGNPALSDEDLFDIVAYIRTLPQ